MNSKIWDFWAKRYDKLWVQKHSLRPTRNYVLELIKKNHEDQLHTKVLDLGCGPGELIEEIQKRYADYEITGIDYSEEMLRISKVKNPGVNHIRMDAAKLNSYDNAFDLIICTHSLPYYNDKAKVMVDLSSLLKDKGKIIMAFASGNNLYDRFSLFFVKLTTGTAYYPSDYEFRELIKPNFRVKDLHVIKERFFMPRIAVYTLEKVKQ